MPIVSLKDSFCHSGNSKLGQTDRQTTLFYQGSPISCKAGILRGPDPGCDDTLENLSLIFSNGGVYFLMDKRTIL